MSSSHAERIRAHTPKPVEHHSHAGFYGPKHSVGEESKAEVVKAEKRERQAHHGR